MLGVSQRRERSEVVVDPTGRRVLRAYLRAVALAEPLQRELAARHGVSLGDLHAVRVLARIGEAPMSRYGKELGVPRSTITNLVDRLERARLVERAPSATDRRVTLVRLAAAGRRAVEDTDLLRRSRVAACLLALEPGAQATLAELLERVVAGLSETPPADDGRGR
jgi:DNA-binding MarR family transcriptional regulator